MLGECEEGPPGDRQSLVMPEGEGRGTGQASGPSVGKPRGGGGEGGSGSVCMSDGEGDAGSWQDVGEKAGEEGTVRGCLMPSGIGRSMPRAAGPLKEVWELDEDRTTDGEGQWEDEEAEEEEDAWLDVGVGALGAVSVC